MTSAVLPSVLITPWYLLPARPMRGSALPLRRSVSGGCWRGDPAVRQEQESRKSPDSVRFLGYL